jgi:phospholipid/cholesterol/gamma-HCH transport system substrate-binding protein
MKREGLNYVAVGAFVLISLIGLSVVLLRVSGSDTSLTRYSVYYGNVHGIIVGTPVFFQGFKVGQVSDVTPLHEGKDWLFDVALDIASTQAIPDDSIARVSESGLLGTVSIDIAGGTSTQLLQPGGRIKGAGRDDLLASINAAADEYRQLSEQQIRPLISKLNQRVDSLANTLEQGSESLIDDLRQLTASLNRSAGQLESLLSSKNLGTITGFFDNMAAFSAQATTVAEGLQSNNHRLGKVLGHANELLFHGDQLITESRPTIKAALSDLRASLRVISRKIGSITRHLENSSRNIDEFSRRIRQNPGLLLGSTPPAGRR